MITQYKEYPLNDANIHTQKEQIPPIGIINAYPLTQKGIDTVLDSRQAIRNILDGKNTRSMLIVHGPCSARDLKGFEEYVGNTLELHGRLGPDSPVISVGRAYGQRPRTISRKGVDWEGLVADPLGKGEADYNLGYGMARKLMVSAVNRGMPIATEFLDSVTPQYLADTVSWNALGARSIETQLLRHVASGLSMPVGYKNATSGDIALAIDAFVTSQNEHTFNSISYFGNPIFIETKGNPHGHIVLRGGKLNENNYTNFDSENVSRAQAMLKTRGLPPYVMIDCSHENANKNHKRQPPVFLDALKQRVDGNPGIIGIMVESYMLEGKQPLNNPLDGFENMNLVDGKSVTDPCISFPTMEELIIEADRALRKKSP